MSAPSDQYWRDREAEQLKHNITNEAEYRKKVDAIYTDMMANTQKEIGAFYSKYANEQGISMADAKKRVSQVDIDAYARKAKKYVAEKDFSPEANEALRLYNLTMKINRLELLKANIGLQMVSSFDELQKFYEQILTDKTLDEFKRQAGIMGKTVQNNALNVNAIVNASFHNATFSERIWAQQDQLRSEIDRLVSKGLILGKHPRELARDLQKRFDVSRYDAERLMVTELARVQTGATQQSYVRNGVTEYTFMASSRACPICRGLDGEHFKVSETMPGENAPPMHPNCHCATAPYEDQAAYEEWLNNRK